MRIALLLLFFGTFSTYAQSADERLAAQFFFDKEYAKAADLYEDLCRKQPESVYFYENLFQCYVLLKDYKSADKMLDKRIKKYPTQYNFQVDKAYLYNLQNITDKRDQLFKELTELKTYSSDEIDILANAFLKRRFYDQAIQTYINARERLKDNTLFAYNLSELYFQSAKLKEATEELMNMLSENDYMMDEIKNRIIVAYKNDEQYKMLSSVLLLKLQKTPDNLAYNDMLIWSFTQQRDWNGALIQAKAIDKRLREEGKRVLALTSIFITNEAYDMALKGYEYIKLLGQDKRYYFQAQQGVLTCGMLRLRIENGGAPEQLKALEWEFLNYLNINGYNWQTAEQMKDLAELYVYYMHQTDKGIEQLNKAITMPGVNTKLLAQCKLNLGDAMLIKGDPWEADLLYKQVEKMFTNDALGQEARYRYARLCYFRGDFEWAQTQLDVLKGATTQLISNNAMRLWLIIQDNLGLDSTDEALKLYAAAELLIFQNKPDEALKKLEEIPVLFPGHTLTDEIYFAKALIYEQKSDYMMAEQLYLRLTKDFSFDILADNALINLARLYEYKLNDTAKARKIYEMIVLNYTGSLFVGEARKRFRTLRGDGMREQEVNY